MNSDTTRSQARHAIYWALRGTLSLAALAAATEAVDDKAGGVPMPQTEKPDF